MIIDRGNDFPSHIQGVLDAYGSDMWLFRDNPDRGTARARNSYQGESRGYATTPAVLRLLHWHSNSPPTIFRTDLSTSRRGYESHPAILWGQGWHARASSTSSVPRSAPARSWRKLRRKATGTLPRCTSPYPYASVFFKCPRPLMPGSQFRCVPEELPALQKVLSDISVLRYVGCAFAS